MTVWGTFGCGSHPQVFDLLTAPCTDMQELGLQGQILDLLFCIKKKSQKPKNDIIANSWEPQPNIPFRYQFINFPWRPTYGRLLINLRYSRIGNIGADLLAVACLRSPPRYHVPKARDCPKLASSRPRYSWRKETG
ncbi:hypothetical protein ACMFMF_007134 [Clarireedia jacksonii]